MKQSASRGILFMVLATLSFSLMEVCVKLASQNLPTLQILWARYIAQLVLVLLIVGPRLRKVVVTRYPRLQLFRSFAVLAATASFFYGYQKNGLVETNAISQSAPIFISLGAALFLGERFGLRRALSLVAGVIGTLIILRPGTDAFSVWLLLPLCGALMYSAYALATRFVGRDEDIWTSLLYAAALSAVALSLVAPFYSVWPAPRDAALLAAIGCLGSAAQLLLTRAFTLAEASAVAPASYVTLIFAASWDLLFFGLRPDGPTVLGALVIVSAGLYVWHRERLAEARA